MSLGEDDESRKPRHFVKWVQACVWVFVQMHILEEDGDEDEKKKNCPPAPASLRIINLAFYLTINWLKLIERVFTCWKYCPFQCSSPDI